MTSKSITVVDGVNFRIPEVIMAWVNRKGEFEKTPDTLIRMRRITFYKGSLYYRDTRPGTHMGYECMRLVKINTTKEQAGRNKLNISMFLSHWNWDNDAVTAENREDKYVILRKTDTYSIGHTFLREMTVSVMPDVPMDHEKNIAWFLDRIVAAAMGRLNKSDDLATKMRVVLFIRREMQKYCALYDLPIPNATHEEMAELTKAVIFKGASEGDLSTIVKEYEWLLGKEFTEGLRHEEVN